MPINHIELTIKNRILEVIKHKQLNIKELANKHQLKHNTLSAQVASESAKVGCSMIYLIAQEHSDVSLEWVMTGRGEMIKPPVQINQPNEIASLSFRLNSAAQSTPIKPVQANNDRVEELQTLVDDYRYMVELQRFKIKKLEEQLKVKAL
jgi:predicted ArsR family transcriptional regulator